MGQWFDGNAKVHIDLLYQTLLPLLPPDDHLGYLSDLSLQNEAGGTIYYQTQFALAPRILLFDPSPRYVIANFENPELFDSFCRDFKLTPVAVARPGLAVLTHVEGQ